MSLPARLVLALLLAIALVSQAPARAEAAPNPLAGLVAFGSDEGLARLARATAKADFPALANHFEAQSNIAFCGPTTAAIVLNALRSGSPDLPRAEDLQHLPGGFDLSVPRFTQDNVIGKGRKTRSQVLGEPVTVNGKQIRDGGYQLRQLDVGLDANGNADQGHAQLRYDRESRLHTGPSAVSAPRVSSQRPTQCLLSPGRSSNARPARPQSRPVPRCLSFRKWRDAFVKWVADGTPWTAAPAQAAAS